MTDKPAVLKKNRIQHDQLQLNIHTHVLSLRIEYLYFQNENLQTE